MSKVLLVGKGPPDRGGIASFLQVLIEGPLATRHDLQLLNLTRMAGSDVNKVSWHNAARAFADAASVWRAARGRDVVHVHSAMSSYVVVLRAGLLCLAGRLGGCRVILHAHSGRMVGWLKGRPRRWFTRLALRPASIAVVVAEGGRRVLSQALGAERVLLVDNGVRVVAFHPADGHNDPPRILYAGVLAPRKGVGDLVRAHRALLERGVAHELWLAGGTPDEGTAAEAAVRQAGAEGVRWLGALPQEAMPDLYRSVDIFCLPSWGEAMPMSVLEAMASSLPVVATRVGDVPRAVVDGETGLLLDARDVGALTDALASLIEDSDRRRRMGKAGLRRVSDHFDASRTLAALDVLYRGSEVPIP